jgi:GAF domain-containing protein
VVTLGIHAVLSVPLVGGGNSIGAIKVYATQVDVFDDRAERVLELFSRQAAVLLANSLILADAHRINTRLTEALQSRDIIGRAKGIILARGAADETEALAMLVTASQRSGTKLRDVAHRLVTATTERPPAELMGPPTPAPEPAARHALLVAAQQQTG